MTNYRKNPSKVLGTVRSVLAGFDAGARVRHGAQVPKNHPSRRRS
ncbi:hypothetical protein [Nocardioides panzhihuensis]|uniref:Uncharacterized protein n=1 Tax=Nocardioides panzhihuensis TaxID=860243 RepID=A0A7Z0DR05_9ACTN|nr:hypothetical protein [Nocardioides panzhihuensis]NYI79741.1 hypothetical protein [Nocardioides panzhihuensis]